jgi:hypothetical protein
MQVLAGLADIVKVKNGHKFTFLKKDKRVKTYLEFGIVAGSREL